MNINTPMALRDEENLSREVLRALKFMEVQFKKGWNFTEVFNQIKGSYGERVAYFVALKLQKIT